MRPALLLWLVVAAGCRSKDPPPSPPAPDTSATVAAATAPSTAGAATAVDAAPSASSSASQPAGLPPLPRVLAKTRTGRCVEEDAGRPEESADDTIRVTSRWVNERVAKARSDHHEIVRLPYDTSGFTRTIMPMDHVCGLQAKLDWRTGIDPFQGKGPDHYAYPELAPASVQGVADGWYKHERVKEKYDPGGSQLVTYDLAVFVLWHVKPADRSGDEPAPSPAPTIVAELDDDEIDVPPLHDDRPWLLILSALPYDAPSVDEEASKQRDRAVAAGFAGADVIDTRQTTQLFCCSRVVVAGRYATPKEANTDLPKARRTWTSAYVRKGW
jgi:hypothetical protein